MKKKVGITADCVCDLPPQLLEEYDMEVIYFYINTDHGCFCDTKEITSANIIEYFQDGGKFIHTTAPSPEEYEAFFRRMLEKYETLLHITVASQLSRSFSAANTAAEQLGDLVHVFDSQHLSIGMGHFIIKAVEMARAGAEREEIVAAMEAMRSKVSTSFIAHDADYLYRNGRVSKPVAFLCSLLHIHPVLGLKKGNLKLIGIGWGNYENAVMRYILWRLTTHPNVDTTRLFIVQASCPVKIINKAKQAVKEMRSFQQVVVADASATITSNCGGNTLGVVFVEN